MTLTDRALLIGGGTLVGLLRSVNFGTVDVGALRSAHPQVKERSDMKKTSDIKMLKEEAAVVADKAEEIKAQYVKYFKV